MKPLRLSRPDSDVFLPAPGRFATAEEALRKATHVCIAAHQDDVEIMSHDAISDCIDDPDTCAFVAVVVTDGAGAPRSGPFAGTSDAALRRLRRDEQRRAAELGGYAAAIQLAHPSTSVREAAPEVVGDLAAILSIARPRILHLHQPADKHDTHVAVLLRCLEALRGLPESRRPETVLGIEVWRSLDWLDEEHRVALNSGRHPELALRLLGAHTSQIAGGKRYDVAAAGRRRANATFSTANTTDRFDGLTWAMDLTEVVRGRTSLEDLLAAHLRRFREDCEARLARLYAGHR